MTAAGVEPRPWGLAEAAFGWIGFQIVGAVAAVTAWQLGDWSFTTPARPGGHIGRAVGQLASGSRLEDDAAPIVAQLLLLAPGWIAMLGGAWYFARALGRSRPGWAIRTRPIDVPLGIATGVLLQVPVIGILYAVLQRIFGDFAPSNRAQTLIDRVDTPLKVTLLILFVAVGAPVVEELFYRGLVQRTLVDRFGAIGGVAATGVIFGAVHFSLVELPALAVAGFAFGALAQRTGRLGPAIIAHVTFNLFTIVFLLLS